MADSDIEWTDKVWNVTRGCRRVSPGCGGARGEGGCYAERQAYRFSGAGQAYEGLVQLTARGPRWTGEGRFDVAKLAEPLRWRRARRIFVDSMSDLFFEGFSNEQIAAVYGVMAACPQHTFQILTKRAARLPEWYEWAARDGIVTSNVVYDCAYLNHLASRTGLAGGPWLDHCEETEGATGAWPLGNVWLGVSVEDRKHGPPRIDDLQRVPAAVRMLSCEPLLENLGTLDLTGIGWVIAGCESGPGARPCHVDWLRSLRDQCKAAGVPFFLKQAMIGHLDLVGYQRLKYRTPASIEPRSGIGVGPGSKRKAGGVIGLPYLDGVQHAEFPKDHR